MSSPARLTAVRAVDRILRTGAYSNVLTARTESLSPEEHAHFQRLVYSTLRWLPYIDGRIEEATDGRRTDHIVHATLRVAIADAAVLDTPDHAVASEYVDVAKGVGAKRAAGFVNGVLRTVLRGGLRSPDRVSDAYPQAVIDVVSTFLPDAADDFLLASNEPAAVGVFSPNIDAPATGIPHTAYVSSSRLAELKRTDPSVQVIDPASAAVALAAEARPGDRILDVAAAPGGKTLVLAHKAGPGGRVVAADLHARRAQSGRRRTDASRRTEHGPVDWVVADGRTPPFVRRSFHRVVLDAPCTGLGTLRRRPEIRHRIDREAPGRYGLVQRALLESALDMVKPGGRLVYSVCTATREETIDVIAGLGFRRPDDLPGEALGDGLLMAPHSTGTDGMFIAVAER